MIDELFPKGVVTLRATVSMEDEALRPLEAASTGRMSKDRLREFALGRACARRALARLGHPNASVPRGPDREPVWPAGVVGSLTHCDDFCGVAVADDDSILSLGLDAELDVPLSEGALKRICTATDLERLDALPDLALHTWGKLLFSAKESFYKCYFALTHTRLGFQDAEIHLDPESQRFEARLIRADAPDAAGFRRFQGRFVLAPPHVLTGVTLQRNDGLY